MRRVSAKFPPRLCRGEQKEIRVTVCTELKDRLDVDPDFMLKIVAGDEYWVYVYDPEMKMQSSKWIVLDSEHIKQSEFATRGTAVNSEYNKGLLKRLRNERDQKHEPVAFSFITTMHHGTPRF